MFEVDGFNFPDLPSGVDRSVYPYALISETSMTGVYGLTFTSEPVYYISTTSKYNTIDSCVCRIYVYGMDGTDGWTLFDNTLIAFSETPIWSDYDILNSETGEVVIPSSVGGETFDYRSLVKEDLLATYKYCLITKESVDDSTMKVLALYSNLPLYLEKSTKLIKCTDETVGIAEEYTKTSVGVTFVATHETISEVLPIEFVVGKYDVNSDGVVDEMDSKMLFNHFMGSQPITDEEVLARVDYNGDGVVDTNDSVTIDNFIESGQVDDGTVAWTNYPLGGLFRIFGSTITAIGKAIRKKLDADGLIAPEEMPELIESIGAYLQDKTITENGTYRPDADFDGFSEVVVNVASGGGGNLLDAEGMVF